MLEKLIAFFKELWKAFEEAAVGTAEWLDGD
jgi:hypothetical protein